MPTDVLLADDQSEIRDWLKTILETAGYQIAGEAANGREAVCQAWRLRPDLVIMDLRMPVLNGLDAAREILKRLPSTRVVICTSYAEESVISEGLRIGIRGFFLKTGCIEEVLRAIREVLAGNLYIAALSPYSNRRPVMELAS